MTPQERLKLYETALIDWTKGLEITYGEKCDADIHAGFCHYFCDYFSNTHGIDIYHGDTFEINFPELFAQRPSNGPSWFYYEDTQSRITCLENAIKLTKETYNL